MELIHNFSLMSQTLQYFKEITAYPRPSKKEEKIRNFLIEFFSGKGYEYTVDTTGNLIVYVPAKNSLSAQTIMLQAHMDMVCVKTPKVTAIHAGLECGALVSGLKKPGVNAISIGPNCQFVHSVKERVEMASIEKLEHILKGILAGL